jgi:hypothetical protein
MAFNQNQGTDCFTRGHLLKIRKELAEKEAKALADLEKPIKKK